MAERSGGGLGRRALLRGATAGSAAPALPAAAGTAPAAGAGEHAAFEDFEPFWEFVSGPLHAGGLPAVDLDGTFGPEQPFVKAPDRAHTSPAESPQCFGEIDIDGGSGEPTVRLRQEGGEVLFTKTLQPGWAGQ